MGNYKEKGSRQKKESTEKSIDAKVRLINLAVWTTIKTVKIFYRRLERWRLINQFIFSAVQSKPLPV
jgi:hypothetical protein